MRLTPGIRVGPYEVVAMLAAGGMAEVYRARDTRLGRDVALKVISETLGADAPLLERFEREAKLAAALNHPNVLALYDVGFHDGRPYLVTELLQGESLRERLVKGPLSLATALEWAAQVAQGLAAAHDRGIVHRDLKPENLFVTRDGHVKVIDFGIGKLVEAARGVKPHALMDETVSPSGVSTGTGMVLGTPGYMSPEQVRGDPADARADFFSFGAVLYEMLSGRRAFPGAQVESAFAILHGEPEALPATIPSPVAQVVRRCLEKDPERRFQSARDLAFNVELLRGPTGVSTPVASDGRPTTSTASWRRWAVRLGVALAMVGAIGMAYLMGTVSRLLRPAPKVEAISFRLGLISAGRFTPDGRVAFSAAWDGQPSQVFVRSPGSLEAQALGLRDVRLLGVSAKGELAVALHPIEGGPWGEGIGLGTLAVVPGAGGTPREVAENVSSADWTPSGELAVVRVSGGKRQLEFPLGTPVFETAGWLASPRVSPSGDLLAVLHLTVSAADELLLVDRQGHLRKLRSFPLDPQSNEKTPTGLAWLPGGEEVWFSTDNAIWAAPLAGSPRLVYQAFSDIRLEDISPSGTVLINAQDARHEIGFVGPGSQRETRLSIFGTGELSALSDDGQSVLFSEYVPGGILTYLRATDGAPPVKLGTGYALALSPDQKWALTEPGEYHDFLSMLPIGAGATKTLQVPGVFVHRARWLQDGKRIAFLGLAEDDKQVRLYVLPIAGGAPLRISPPVGPLHFEVSRDDRLAAVRGLDELVTLYPLDGGPPVALPDLGPDVVPAGWNKNGELWVWQFREVPSHLLRFDIKRRLVVEERTVGPSDSTGVSQLWRVRITPDGRALAFDYERSLGRLLLVEGLVPVRR